MVETLKKKAKKSNILRVIFSIIGVVALLAITKFALFDVITGPTRMDITADPETYYYIMIFPTHMSRYCYCFSSFHSI